MTYESNSPADTFELGRRMGEAAHAGEIYTMDGDLGAGKTVFAQGFAAGLGIAEPVNSPTFTILQSYPGGRLPLHHFDVYRIAEPEEMDEIGYEEFFFGDGVCLIEWSGLIEELIPENAVRMQFFRMDAEHPDRRRITCSGPGQHE